MNLEVEKKLVIEHLKETNTSWHDSHNFGINFGAMVSFGNIPSVTSVMMATPVVRNGKGCLIEETLAESGIYAKDKTIKIGQTIEITPTIRNEEKISVFATSIASSIGSIMSGVQEIKDNWKTINEPTHHDIIIDTEPCDVIQGHNDEKPVTIDDTDPKTHKKQDAKEPDYAINEQEARELLDEIYDADIAPYHEFESIQRPDSPKRTDTKLTRAVTGVIDYAKALEAKVNCYTKAVFQAINYVSDVFSAPFKPFNEYVISPALEAIGTCIRRTLRDDCRFSQGFAQDAGDMSSIVAGLLIPCRIVKVPGKVTKLKVPDRVAQRKIGNVGKAKNLKNGGAFNDGKDVHHIPSQRYLNKHGLNPNDGLSIILPKPQHIKTRTYGKKGAVIDLNSTYRNELAKDLKDVKKILKDDGMWKSAVKQSILKGLDNFRKEYPQLFEKVKK